VRTLLVALFVAHFVVLSSAAASAPFKEPETGKGPGLGDPVTTRLKIGFTVKAGGLMFRGIATAPVPTDWPEQQVTIVKEDVTSAVKNLKYREISGGGGLKQMVAEIPQLPAGQEAHALVIYEITRRAILPPADTSIYRIPKRVDRATQLNLGPSPLIESKHPKIVAAAKGAISEDQNAWQQVEALYDWTRNNIKFITDGGNEEPKGAAQALHEGKGYTDELTSIFVAMCRAIKVPARTVFVQGHCYAEFYLEDDDGKGHWFPAQLVGTRSFGELKDMRPILQKGDNFKNPENTKEKLRYVREYFHASGKGASPKVKFFGEPVSGDGTEELGVEE